MVLKPLPSAGIRDKFLSTSGSAFLGGSLTGAILPETAFKSLEKGPKNF